MKKYRINTTISQKHWDLLKKHANKFDTQQKVLEIALENLDNSLKEDPKPSPEEQLWMRHAGVKSSCMIQKDGLKKLMETADIEQFREIINGNGTEFAIEYYFQKPLKECSLEEIVEGMLVNARMSNWFDTAYYTDNGDYYTVNMTHTLGINTSKIIKLLNESMLKTYEARAETTISEKTIFIKIYKKRDNNISGPTPEAMNLPRRR